MRKGKRILDAVYWLAILPTLVPFLLFTEGMADPLVLLGTALAVSGFVLGLWIPSPMPGFLAAAWLLLGLAFWDCAAEPMESIVRAVPDVARRRLEVRKEIPAPHSLGGDLAHPAIDQRRGILLLPLFMEDVLTRVDLQSGRILDLVSLERGIKFVTYDPLSDLVIASGFVTGTVFILDGETGAMIKKLSVGKRARIVTPPRSRLGLAYVASSAGIFEIDLGAVLRGRR